MHLLCTSHTLTCTRTNGELQKNRHGNHKAQMVKRHGGISHFCSRFSFSNEAAK